MADWNPALYSRFEDERTRPARELLARVALEAPRLAYDLGCGPGNSTELLTGRWPGAEVIGTDNSEAMLATYDVGDLEAIKKYSSITIDSAGIITEFEEKPAEPKSTLTGIALYYFSREVVPLFRTYLAAGNNPDQPGRFIQWLYPRQPVKTYQIRGTWFDIGSKETLDEANEIFAKFVPR